LEIGDSRLYIFTSPHWQKIAIQDSATRTNLPLGVMQPVVYDEVDIPVSPGDIVFTYTDGVIETPNFQGELFGLENLLETLQNQASEDPNQIKQSVLDALTRFSPESLSHDDVTMLALRACPLPRFGTLRAILANRVFRPITRRRGARKVR